MSNILSQIYEGWRNKLVPPAHLKNMIELTSKSRTDICLGCEHHSENAKRNKGYKSIRPDHHCVECGCMLSAKTRCLSCECPLKKWEAVMSNIEEEQIKKQINGKK
jgi:hypothetical protein